MLRRRHGSQPTASRPPNVVASYDKQPLWGPGGLSRECVLRIPMRVVKGDNQSLKIEVARPGIEPRSSCSVRSQELNHSATAAPMGHNVEEEEAIGNSDIIFAFQEHLVGNSEWRFALSKHKVSLIVIDELHRSYMVICLYSLYMCKLTKFLVLISTNIYS